MRKEMQAQALGHARKCSSTLQQPHYRKDHYTSSADLKVLRHDHQHDYLLSTRSISAVNIISSAKESFQTPNIKLYSKSRYRDGYYQLLTLDKNVFHNRQRLLPFVKEFNSKRSYERLEQAKKEESIASKRHQAGSVLMPNSSERSLQKNSIGYALSPGREPIDRLVAQ